MKVTPRSYAEAYLELAERVAPKGLSDLAHEFWNLVARQRRFAWRKRILHEVEELSRERSGRVLVEVTTAREGSGEIIKTLERGLAKGLGKEIEVRSQVKPHLLSGVVVEVGDKRYDASLKGRLDALERALAGEMTV